MFCFDSQGRNVKTKTEHFRRHTLNVFGYVTANAELLQDVDSTTIDQENLVITMGGSNDSLDKALHNI